MKNCSKTTNLYFPRQKNLKKLKLKSSNLSSSFKKNFKNLKKLLKPNKLLFFRQKNLNLNIKNLKKHLKNFKNLKKLLKTEQNSIFFAKKPKFKVKKLKKIFKKL